MWLKYADSLQVLNDLEGAAMAFSKVLALAPHHTETRSSVQVKLHHCVMMKVQSLKFIVQGQDIYSIVFSHAVGYIWLRQGIMN